MPCEVVTAIERNGRHGWKITDANGVTRTVWTSRSSMAVIDKACRLYAKALKRLAEQ